MTIQVKAIKHYVPAVWIIVLCKVVLTFEFVDKIQQDLQRGLSNEGSLTVRFCGTGCNSFQNEVRKCYPVLKLCAFESEKANVL